MKGCTLLLYIWTDDPLPLRISSAIEMPTVEGKFAPKFTLAIDKSREEVNEDDMFGGGE